jgi:hypothetical protein
MNISKINSLPRFMVTRMAAEFGIVLREKTRIGSGI